MASTGVGRHCRRITKIVFSSDSLTIKGKSNPHKKGMRPLTGNFEGLLGLSFSSGWHNHKVHKQISRRSRCVCLLLHSLKQQSGTSSFHTVFNVTFQTVFFFRTFHPQLFSPNSFISWKNLPRHKNEVKEPMPLIIKLNSITRPCLKEKEKSNRLLNPLWRRSSGFAHRLGKRTNIIHHIWQSAAKKSSSSSSLRVNSIKKYREQMSIYKIVRFSRSAANFSIGLVNNSCSKDPSFLPSLLFYF